jgi:hypothetical protein
MKFGQSGAIVLIAACAVSMPTSGQISSQTSLEACIPAHQFIELPQSIAGSQTDAYGQTRVALGAYERVSPDGRFILRSYSGGRLGDVSLIELSPEGRVLRAIDMPFKNEAFPVQGSWRYLVDTNGDHYTLQSVVRNSGRSDQPRPVFRGGMDGFYAAAAELPASKAGHVRIRSLSWPNSNGDSQTQGEGALVSRTLEIDTQRHRITVDSGPVFHCRERVRLDGPMYALPMISVDGHEFSALPQTPVQGKQTMRVFGFGDDGKSCALRESFDFSSGKAIFGFASAQQAANLAWEYQGMAWWYSRELKAPFNIAPFELEGRKLDAQFELIASAFPGLTRDGRVIYGATLKDCASKAVGDSTGRCRERAGYMISDPYQSNAYRNFMLSYKGPARQQCITQGDVLREREAFGKMLAQ